MRSDHIMTWFSTTKAVLAVTVAQCAGRDLLSFEDPVAKFLPEFAQGGKDRVTIRHCLTHTAGLWEATFTQRHACSLDEAVKAVCDAPLADKGTWPLDGSRCAYDSPAFQVLGKVVERCDPQRRPFDQYVREEVFLPLGMHGCFIGMSHEQHGALNLAGRFGAMHGCVGRGQPTPQPEAVDVVCECNPSSNGRGPAEELVRIFDALAHDGIPSLKLKTNGQEAFRLLQPGAATKYFSSRWREGVYDELQGVDAAWSLGFAVGSVLSGQHSSPNTFGHGGSQSSFGFADPEAGLAVVCICNGRPGPTVHYERVEAIADSIYEDLGLAGMWPRRQPRVPAKQGSI